MVLLILLLLLVTSVPYLTVGAKVARNRYALDKYNYKLALAEANSSESKKTAAIKRIAELKRQKAGLPHKSYCHLNYPNLARLNGCSNCDSQSKWHRLGEEISQLEKTMKYYEPPVEPEVPFRTLVTWPVTKLGDYLTSGEVKKANPFYIEELERLNDMKQLH